MCAGPLTTSLADMDDRSTVTDDHTYAQAYASYQAELREAARPPARQDPVPSVTDRVRGLLSAARRRSRPCPGHSSC